MPVGYVYFSLGGLSLLISLILAYGLDDIPSRIVLGSNETADEVKVEEDNAPPSSPLLNQIEENKEENKEAR